MTLSELLFLAIPAAAIVSFRYSSVNWVKRVSWVPAVQFFLMAALIFIDGQCQGDGFKLSWINCGNQFMDQYANAAAGLLYFNMFSILGIPLVFVALVIVEVITRRAKK